MAPITNRPYPNREEICVPSLTYDLSTLIAHLASVCEEPRRTEVQRLQERLRAGDLRILVGGEAKRGKSTLTNALLGRPMLPTGVTPVTALQTVVRAGSPERVEVDFLDGSHKEAGLEDLAGYVTQAENPGNRKQVAEVRTILERLPHPRIVFIDTPGIGSVIDHNSEIADKAMQTMDLAVFVLTADAPISRSEATLLARFATLSVDVLVVLNKADLLAENDVEEAVRFVRDSAEEVLGHRLDVYVCSARDGLSARLAGDEAGWASSGLAPLERVLLERAAHGREETLRSSIIATAVRLAARQHDEMAVQVAGLEALRDDRDDELAAFGTALEQTVLVAAEAHDLLDRELTRQAQRIDAEAAGAVAPLTRETLTELNGFLDDAGGLDPRQVESRGREVIAETVRGRIEGYRGTWHAQLRDTLARQHAREEELLAQGFHQVAEATEQHLGVRLTASVPDLGQTGLGDLRYDFRPGIGWDAETYALARRIGPGASRRMARFLREEGRRLADMHLGRARADLRYQLDETGRRMHAALTRAFDDLTSGMGRASRSAYAVRDAGAQDIEPELRRLVERRQALEQVIDHLGG